MLKIRTLAALTFVISLVFGSIGFGDPPTQVPVAEFPAPPPATQPLLGPPSAPLVEPFAVPQPRAAAEGAAAEVVPSQPSVAGDAVLDAELIRRGGVEFERNCTSCHDGAKSLDKAKPFQDWMATIRRMSEKADASIPAEAFEPIAAYLASRHPQPAADAPTPAATWLMPAPGVTINGTLSPTFRGGNDFIQNPGFFPDVWLGVNFNNGSPLTARTTACISCHGEGGTGGGIELVDAVLRLDLMRSLGYEHPAIRSSVEAGRFIVPFGAFAAQSNPGVYRTVSRPLMYNMGQRVRDEDLGDPVLPMPYSDEGAVYSLGVPLTQRINLNLDGYVVNGLQGTADGVDFDLSRSYTASNKAPSVGGRATLGNDVFRVGASAIGGTFSPSGGVGINNAKMGYHIFGFDMQYHYRDVFRFQAEYARRNSDHQRGDPAVPFNAPDVVDGCYAEGELLLFDFLRTSTLFRYDWQRHAAPTAANFGVPVDAFNVQRFTTGLNFTLRGGSLLMLNYEYWLLPTGFDSLSVYGARWAMTF